MQLNGLSKVFVVVILSYISFEVLSETNMPSKYTLNAWHALLKIDRKGLWNFFVEGILNRAVGKWMSVQVISQIIKHFGRQ